MDCSSDSIYTATHLVLAIVFINLKIVDFLRNGIFLPSVDILSVNNLYIFSCLEEGLYLINGFSFVACIILNIISSGIFISKLGLITALIYFMPFFT